MTTRPEHGHVLPKVGDLQGLESIPTQNEGKTMLARLGLSIFLAAGPFTPVSSSTIPSRGQTSESGRALAETHCATCHAVGKRGQSPNPQAPRFATLGSRYPLDHLAEAFSEGILVGHGPMPEFQFEPDQIDALIAYLRSVQNPMRRAKKRELK